MKYTTNIQEIEKILVGRTALDQEFALELSSVFRTGDLYRRINIAVNAAFLFLGGLKSEPPLKAKIEELEVKNAFLFHTNPKTVEGVLADRDKGLWLTPEQCGNLIRFYGEVVEACAAFSVYWKKERAKQIGWRYGGGGEAFKASRNPDYVAQPDKGSVWRKTVIPVDKDGHVIKGVGWVQQPNSLWKKVETDPSPEPGGRIRTKAEGFFKKGANPYYDIIPGNLFDNPALKDVHIGKKFGGVMVWKIEDTSTIGKIDRVFGLPFGADISGTTTDNLYFLTGWADASKGDPLVMMLPLAAIIGEYHHALLEVAAAMSLRKVISYSIGFYSTLLPPLPGGIAPQAQRGDIIALLDKFDKDPRNQHVLLHYNKNNKIAGCFIGEGDELGAFKELGKVDMRLWPRFNSLPAYPPEDKIMGLLAEVGLANAALASRRGALRGGKESAEMEQKRLEKKLGIVV